MEIEKHPILDLQDGMPKVKCQSKHRPQKNLTVNINPTTGCLGISKVQKSALKKREREMFPQCTVSLYFGGGTEA
jgi:hypothetical protein